jgi:hypothetical protein
VFIAIYCFFCRLVVYLAVTVLFLTDEGLSVFSGTFADKDAGSLCFACRRVRRDGFSASRRAITEPEEPKPQTTKS